MSETFYGRHYLVSVSNSDILLSIEIINQADSLIEVNGSVEHKFITKSVASDLLSGMGFEHETVDEFLDIPDEKLEHVVDMKEKIFSDPQNYNMEPVAELSPLGDIIDSDEKYMATNVTELMDDQINNKDAKVVLNDLKNWYTDEYDDEVSTRKTANISRPTRIQKCKVKKERDGIMSNVSNQDRQDGIKEKIGSKAKLQDTGLYRRSTHCEGTAKPRGKHKRPIRYCKFCNTIKKGGKLNRHIISVHKNELSVKSALRLPMKERVKMFEKFRVEGIYKYNMNLLCDKNFNVEKHDLVLRRRRSEHSRPVMCTVCLHFVSGVAFLRHKRRCEGATPQVYFPGLTKHTSISMDEYVETVIRKLKDDDAGILIKSSEEIHKIGYNLFIQTCKNNEDVEKMKRKNIRDVRDVSRLFLVFRNIADGDVEFEDMFSPVWLPQLIKAINLFCIKENSERYNLKLRLNTLIQRVVEALQQIYVAAKLAVKCTAIKEFSAAYKQRVKEVTTYARSRVYKKYNKQSKVVLTTKQLKTIPHDCEQTNETSEATCNGGNMRGVFSQLINMSCNASIPIQDVTEAPMPCNASIPTEETSIKTTPSPQNPSQINNKSPASFNTAIQTSSIEQTSVQTSSLPHYNPVNTNINKPHSYVQTHNIQDTSVPTGNLSHVSVQTGDSDGYAQTKSHAQSSVPTGNVTDAYNQAHDQTAVLNHNSAQSPAPQTSIHRGNIISVLLEALKQLSNEAASPMHVGHNSQINIHTDSTIEKTNNSIDTCSSNESTSHMQVGHNSLINIHTDSTIEKTNNSIDTYSSDEATSHMQEGRNSQINIQTDVAIAKTNVTFRNEANLLGASTVPATKANCINIPGTDILSDSSFNEQTTKTLETHKQNKNINNIQTNDLLVLDQKRTQIHVEEQQTHESDEIWESILEDSLTNTEEETGHRVYNTRTHTPVIPKTTKQGEDLGTASSRPVKYKRLLPTYQSTKESVRVRDVDVSDELENGDVSPDDSTPSKQFHESVRWSKTDTNNLKTYFRKFFAKAADTCCNNKGSLPSKREIMEFMADCNISSVRQLSPIESYRKIRTKLFNERKKIRITKL